MAIEEKASGSDSDDQEFMQKVNVYLNASDSFSSSGGALEGILRRNSSFNKVVKFAMDEEELEDARRDAERSRHELLAKITRLTDMLKEAESQVTLERDKRKKKEKNLLKLAKELKKRNQQKEKDMDRMEELEEKKKYLEHHWVLAQKELDQEKVFRDKAYDESIQEYEKTIAEEKEKYSKVCKEHEERIAEMKKSHQKQCDELCREILKANLEADRLHSQLNDGATRSVKLFGKGPTKKRSWTLLLLLLSIAVAVFAVWKYDDEIFTMDTLCAPVMPGTTLNSMNTGTVFDAPWWAPSSFKGEAFEKLCSHQASAFSVQWFPDGQQNHIIISQGQNTFLNKRSLVKAEISGNIIRLWNKKGVAEDHQSLWSSQN